MSVKRDDEEGGTEGDVGESGSAAAMQSSSRDGTREQDVDASTTMVEELMLPSPPTVSVRTKERKPPHGNAATQGRVDASATRSTTNGLESFFREEEGISRLSTTKDWDFHPRHESSVSLDRSLSRSDRTHEPKRVEFSPLASLNASSSQAMYSLPLPVSLDSSAQELADIMKALGHPQPQQMSRASHAIYNGAIDSTQTNNKYTSRHSLPEYSRTNKENEYHKSASVLSELLTKDKEAIPGHSVSFNTGNSFADASSALPSKMGHQDYISRSVWPDSERYVNQYAHTSTAAETASEDTDDWSAEGRLRALVSAALADSPHK